jgi:hypothetical protein
MIKQFKCVSVIILLFIFCSCSKNPIKFGQIKAFSIEEYKSNELSCKAELEISNDNIFPLNIEVCELYAFSDNTELGIVKMPQPIKIRGNSKQLYTLHFTVEITDPEAGMFSLLSKFTGKKPKYSLKGTINAKSFLVNKKIAVDEVLGN